MRSTPHPKRARKRRANGSAPSHSRAFDPARPPAEGRPKPPAWGRCNSPRIAFLSRVSGSSSISLSRFLSLLHPLNNAVQVPLGLPQFREGSGLAFRCGVGDVGHRASKIEADGPILEIRLRWLFRRGLATRLRAGVCRMPSRTRAACEAAHFVFYWIHKRFPPPAHVCISGA